MLPVGHPPAEGDGHPSPWGAAHRIPLRKLTPTCGQTNDATPAMSWGAVRLTLREWIKGKWAIPLLTSINAKR